MLIVQMLEVRERTKAPTLFREKTFIFLRPFHIGMRPTCALMQIFDRNANECRWAALHDRR
jgi:hypothetical protein